MHFRKKTALLAIIPVIAIIGIIIVVKYNNEPEPLTQEEILKKQDWKPNEISYTLARNFKPQAGDRDRHAILEHLNRQIQKYPEAQQQQIKVQAIRQAIDDTIKQYRTLSAESRAQLVTTMQQRAEKNYNSISKMSSGQRANAVNQMASPEAKAFTGELNNAMYNKLSPEERRDFNPIAKLWLDAIKKL